MSSPTAASLGSLSSSAGSPLRLVLFGMPDAGKSSLLGAIVQAAQSQVHLLNGHLTPVSEGLAELHRRLYEESPKQTVEEIVPYRLTFKPFPAPGRPDADEQEVVWIDCDGRVANDLLARRRSLEPAGDEASLAGAIAEADALILVIDASAGPTQVNADFTEFARFLRLLEHNRGKSSEISGLPVFLVLTKCDLLARPGDGLAGWLERIEEHKNQVAERFRSFLAHEARAHVPFGRIDLHVWATAVKRPALADSPAKPREPYGVAELIRQALEYADTFRHRRRVAGRRLLWIAAGSLGLVGAMGVLATTLLVYPHRPEPGELERTVSHYRAQQQAQSPREQYLNVKLKIDDLNDFRSRPGYDQLPAELRDYVETRLQDLRAFQALENQLASVADPKDAKSEGELQDMDAALAKAEMIAEPYRTAWNRTDAMARLYTDRDDVKALLAAAKTVRAGYQKLVEDGRRVVNTRDDPNLIQRAKAVMERAKALPDARTDGAKPIPGSPRVTYTTVFALRGIDELLRQWDDIRKKLEPVANLGG